MDTRERSLNSTAAAEAQHTVGLDTPLRPFQTGSMAIVSIHIVSVPVTDQDRAKRFYLGVLGFDLIRENPMGGDLRWVQVAPRGSSTAITLVTWSPTMPPGSLKGLVLETDDLDSDVAALLTAGVGIDDGIQEQPWGRFVTFDDPDGTGIVLQSTAPDA